MIDIATLSGRAEPILTLSTSHITREDNALLRDRMRYDIESSDTDSHEWMELFIPGGWATSIQAGWLIRLYKDGDDDVRKNGFSSELIDLLAACRKAGIYWLRLDRDADQIDGIPVFEW